jgi:hypothetical protein
MTEKQRLLFPTLIALTMLFVLLGQLVTQWVLFRYHLYDSQPLDLNPEHYQATILTAQEFAQLADPNTRTVVLAAGEVTLSKPDLADWENRHLLAYQSVYNGRYHVKLTTKGTAHILPYFSSFLPQIFFFGLAAFLVLLIQAVKQARQKGVTMS